MNLRKPQQDNPSGNPQLLVAALGVLIAFCCVACSSHNPTRPSSPTRTSASATLTTATTATDTSATTGPSTATSTSPSRPVARCPALKAEATPQVPLECTSATIIGAAAARVGLKRQGDRPTILPTLSLLSYYQDVLIPLSFRREVNIFHYTNGAVASLLCSGVVAKTLDPVLGVCLDQGPSTRTDRPAVRAWALRAQATISKSAKAQPSLTSGKLTFVACSDPSFPKTSDKTTAFEMNIYIQHSGGSPGRGDCPR